MRPCFRRTHLPSFKSIAGMISIEIIQSRILLDAVPREEIAQQLQTAMLTLLGVELHGEDIAFVQRCCEFDAITGKPGGLLPGCQRHVVAVHEIEPRVVLDALPERMLIGLMSRSSSPCAAP
jgi:hypothetical protein